MKMYLLFFFFLCNSLNFGQTNSLKCLEYLKKGSTVVVHNHSGLMKVFLELSLPNSMEFSLTQLKNHTNFVFKVFFCFFHTTTQLY